MSAASPPLLLKPFLAEARINLRLAAPLIVAQLCFVGMGTVDTLLAGRLNAEALAAVAVGSNIWFVIFVLFMGITMAISPIVAQRVGAGQAPQQIGRFVSGALWLGLLLGLLWSALMWLLAMPVLELLGLEPRTHAYARDYLGALNWAGVPFALSFVLRNAAEGHGLTRVPLVAAIVGFLVNGLFGWLLLHGHAGLPTLGPAGLGWASVLAGCAMVAVYALQYRWTLRLRALHLATQWRPRIDFATFEVLRVGLPIAAILTAECSLFAIGAMMMARFGTDAVAAHQIAINFASLAFMVPLSIGMATTVRVGQAAGAGNPAAVALRGRVGIVMSIGFALMSAALMGLAPGAIVGLYTHVERLAGPAVIFLGYAAVFQIFDCVQATSNGALRGLKDTRLPMVITLAGYWGVGMPLAVGLAFYTATGPAGIWWGFIGGLAVAAVGLSARFLRRAPTMAGWQAPDLHQGETRIDPIGP